MSDRALHVADRGDRSLAIVAGETDIATYVFDPDVPEVEARKPYLHPMRTLSGALVSAFRPWDHRWHKGLQMTSSHLSGQNFWGGKTFRLGEGYLWLDNVGQMKHDSFEISAADDGSVTLAESLSWLTFSGERWVAEERTLRFSLSGTDERAWMIDYSSVLRNTRGEPLEMGSPTTHGRPDAGYTGLFWRGPRSWTGGEIIAADGQGGESMMGREAPWLAITGQHDEIEGGATMLFFSGTSSAKVPITWFVRSEPFAAINPSPAFHEEVTIDTNGSLELSHRAVVFDAILARDELEHFAKTEVL
jgi:hypothetical protein